MAKNCSLQKFCSLLLTLVMVVSIFQGLALTTFAEDQSNSGSLSVATDSTTGNTATPAVTGTPLEKYGKLKVIGANLCDENGIPIQLRGMSSFGLQWGDGDWVLTDEAFDALANDWECDIIRLAMYVSEGGYASNPSGMLAKLEKGIKLATDRGMYVMVDWHVLSPGDPNSPVYLAAGLGDESMPAEFKAIRDAHTDWTGPQVFFAYIAQKYGNQGNVLYEPANEPNGLSGSGADKDVARRKTAWSTSLKPYFESVIDVIRDYDDNGIIICGTDNWSQYVDGPVGDSIDDDNIMYTMHFYAGTHDAGYEPDQDEPSIMGKYWLRKMVDNAMANGLPVFCTEWGISDASGDGGPFVDFAERWMNYLDSKNISWCAWSMALKNEVSAAFVRTASKNPNGAWDYDDDLSVAGRFYRAMIRGDEVPMYEAEIKADGLLGIQADNKNENISVEGDTIDGKNVSKISNTSINGVWDNRLEFVGNGLNFGASQELVFDVYLPKNKVNTGSGNSAFIVNLIFQTLVPGNDWNSGASTDMNVPQNSFAPVAGTDWVKATVAVPLAGLGVSSDATLKSVIFLISLTGATADSDVCIGNLVFITNNNGDILYNPSPDKPGEFIKLPFDFESGTREGWAKDGDSKIQNTDLSVGIAETQALMFPAAFEPGKIEWEDGVRLGSPFWPESAMTLDDCKNIGAVSMDIYLEDGKATTGELGMIFLPVPNGAGYWHQLDKIIVDPVNGGTIITNSEGKKLRKYSLVSPFTIADYSEEVRVRNLNLVLNGDSDYSGNVYYDNIGFLTKDELNNDTPVPNPDSSSGGSSSSSGGGSGSSSISNLPASVNQASTVGAVSQAVIAAKKAGSNTASVTLKNVSDITLNNMKAINNAAKDTTVKLNADSMNGNVVDVRISIDPSKATKNINLYATTTSQAAKNTLTTFAKYYDNKVSVVSLSQQGDFGMPVEIAAKIGKELDAKTLVFYSYDKATNSYKLITGAKYWIDKNGYVHFTTTLAGDIIITDKPLVKK